MKNFILFTMGFVWSCMPEIAGESLYGKNAGLWFLGVGAASFFIGYMCCATDENK
jgi:hypothetical protein